MLSPQPDRRTAAAPVVAAACVVAGLAVGLVEGARVVVGAGLGGSGALATVALVAGVDALLGLLLGLGAAIVVAATRWGRREGGARLPVVLGHLLAGAGAFAATAGAVFGTASRNNRFLAAGVVALASAGAAALGALVGPALGRLASGGARGRRSWTITPGGLLLVAPLALLVAEAIVFVLVWRAGRPPLPPGVRLSRALAAAAVSAPLPLALAWAAGRPLPLRWPKAAALAGALFVLPVVALVSARWVADFRFLPWGDVAVGAAILAASIALAVVFARRPPRRRANAAAGALLPVVVLPLALPLALFGAEAEEARKAARQTGLVAEIVARARPLFDGDRDGYPARLGGGDCDDRDREVNPGALDWPGDGRDQDCDGADATPVAGAPPISHPVPDAVPRDLNVLFVTIDTLRADRLGCYGYERKTSPALDRLAADGIVFENGWAHAPSTRYSMPAIALSRWPSTIAWDMSIWWPRMAPGARTVGEAFKAMGYATGAFYAYLYFNREDARGFERGIDVYDASLSERHMNIGGDPAHSRGSSSREMADKGIAFLEQRRGEKFFLWLHFYDPHLEYERHPEAPDFGSSQSDLYDGEIWFTDHHFGRVVAALERLGLYDKTAIVVTGDHGEGLGERGIVAHGYDLYAPQTKVPFVARVPGLPPRRVKAPIGHVDLAPTLVNLARGEREKTFLGRSMVDVLAGAQDPAVPVEPVFQDFGYEGPTEKRGLASETHHLLWNWRPDNTFECYDLVRDPGETRDLWATGAGEACKPLRDRLVRKAKGLLLPAGLAEKLAFGVLAGGGAAAAPKVPVDARFGAFARYVGFDVSAPIVAPGGAVEVVHHFDVLEAPPAGWRLFFHLEGPGGFRNLDHDPVEGAHPVSKWKPGQRIRDRHTIAFGPASPPGVYTLHVGFWRGGDRLPLDPPHLGDGQNRLKALTITVQ